MSIPTAYKFNTLLDHRLFPNNTNILKMIQNDPFHQGNKN